MSAPPSVTRPVSGRSKPAMIRSVVVLPEPEGPRSVKNSPSPTVRSTSSTATTSPYVLRIPSTRTSAAKAALEDVEAALELVVANRKGDEDADHVAVDAAREEQQATLAGLARDSRRLLPVLLGQLDRDHGAEAAHLRPLGCHRGDQFLQSPPDCLGARARALERVEDRERRGTGERVAAERPAEAPGRDGVHQVGPPGDGGERKPPAERLAAHGQVGLDAVVLDRPN